MLKQSYSEKDLEELTETAKTMWEIDLNSKRIKRKKNVIDKKVPLQAIYRMTKEEWATNANAQKFRFPFINSNFHRILGFIEGWSISVEDRNFIEKDMYLFSDNGYTILIDVNIKRFWETTWFNILSISVGVVGLIFGIIGIIR